jgi:cytoskeletal protein CcmA (bactofilin family)
LVCYSCQYKFTVTGSLAKLFCPKCREQLESGDHNIEGSWTSDILTVGKVHIKSGAKVVGASIVANDIIVGGDCSEANLKPVRHIELETGAVVSPGVLNNHKVIIRAGAKIALDTPLRCSDLDIYGELHAKAIPTGTVTLFAGGMFRGELNASSLIVNDGGGLSADLKISPVAEKTKTKPKTAKTGPAGGAVGGNNGAVSKKADKHASQLSFERLK